MSLNIIKRNSSSPFNQQRSMVSQSGAGGAYEEGGFNPDNVYNNNAMLTAIVGFGDSLGKGLSAVTAKQRNQGDVNKSERLTKKVSDIKKENAKATIKVEDAKDPRLVRINKRLDRVNSRINTYNEFENPTLKSDIESIEPKKTKTTFTKPIQENYFENPTIK